MTNEANRRIGAFIEDEMARQGLNRSDVLRLGGMSDNKTLQTAIEGTRTATLATRGKIERALGLEAGTLAAVGRGEHPTGRERRKVSDTELIAMLAERLSELRAEVEELRRQPPPVAADNNNVTELKPSPFDPAVTPPEPNELREEPYLLDEAAREDTGQPNPGEGDDEVD